MDAEHNKQLVMNGYHLFQSGDIANLLERFHDDMVWTGPESDLVPFAGTFRGKGEIAQFFAKLAQSQQALRFVPQEFIAEGDKVVVTGEATWRVNANGNTYDSQWVNVFTVRDDKVVRIQAYHDMLPAEKAFRPAQPGQSMPASTLHH